MSSQRFSIACRFNGHGWIDVLLSHGDKSQAMGASYFGDFPSELIAAANLLLKGLDEARVCLAELPGEWRWILRRSDDELSLRVLFFSDGPSDASDERGSEEFATTVTVHKFARAAKRAIDGLIPDQDLTNYERQWGHPFPTRSHDRLKAIL